MILLALPEFTLNFESPPPSPLPPHKKKKKKKKKEKKRKKKLFSPLFQFALVI